MSEQLELHERITAGRMLSTAAAQISRSVDLFCSWLLIGVGGAYALIFANLDSLHKLVYPHSLQTSLILLLIAIVLGIFQRWLAAIVASTAVTNEKSEQIGKELAEKNINVDFNIVFREVARGTYYPSKWMLNRSFKQVMSGDFAASGRLTAKISQVQSWLALLLAIFVVAAIAVTICGIKV